MRVAVVTPYYMEPPAVLRQCHESVQRQRHPCRHYLVADGHPLPDIDGWQAEHLRLPRPHGDAGNVARCLGAMAAAGDGVDAVAFLDADNWYREDHLESLVALHRRTGALVCTSGRDIHAIDGALMIPGGEPGDGEDHADTSCLWFHRHAFELMSLWGTMPHDLWPIGDRVLWAAVKARDIPRAHTGMTTLAYRSQWAVHYPHPAPEGTKSNDHVLAAFGTWERLPEETRQRLLLGYKAGSH